MPVRHQRVRIHPCAGPPEADLFFSRDDLSLGVDGVERRKHIHSQGTLPKSIINQFNHRKCCPMPSSADTINEAWGVLEQRVGNLSAARRLFRSSLNINSQSYVTWMTRASFEEDQGNSVRAEEIRNLYFQQRTEIVDDASWVMGLLDIIDPAFDSIKRFLNLDQNSYYKVNDTSRDIAGANDKGEESASPSSDYNNAESTESSFDLDAFILERLSLDPSKLDILLERTSQNPVQKKTRSLRRVWRLEDRTTTTLPKL